MFLSFNIGFYPTIVSKSNQGRNETTSFIRFGISIWYLPWGRYELPSAMYSNILYIIGLNKSYKGQSGIMLESGARFILNKNWNFRFGGALLKAPHHEWKLNPTPGFSYSFKSKQL